MTNRGSAEALRDFVRSIPGNPYEQEEELQRWIERSPPLFPPTNRIIVIRTTGNDPVPFWQEKETEE
jgi:hypothetical protein